MALYDVRSDFSLANDLAAQNPTKLAEMQALFLSEAAKYGVLPIDDRVFERLDPKAVGRPDIMGGRTSLTLAEGMAGMMEGVFINIKNRSKTITAEIEVPANGGNGTILAQGGRFGGWSLYVKNGVPAYDYNFLGLQRTTIASPAVAAGKARLRSSSPTTAAGRARAGWGRCSSTARRWPRGVSSTRRGACSRPTRRRTSASISARPSSKPSGRRRSPGSPGGSPR